MENEALTFVENIMAHWETYLGYTLAIMAGFDKVALVFIKTLDNILTGQGAPANVQRQTDVQQQIGAALAPFQQYMSREKQRQDYTQQQERNEVNGTLNAFAADPQNEFYNDVKMEMADLLDMASNRNREMTLAQAYEKACQLNPEIYGIIQGRSGAKSVAEKRHAAASISGTLGGPGGGTEPGDMRGAIEDAWANAGRA